ncbi:unnamed protein product [Arabidopsis thaliana]|uniref:Uncharacterized protein n=1 Tax=Arabidopsis thaliana TaxID=3702 RepID=A0A654EB95_ARATH|nr:unnamed protein product [Arabidopsis thaliana]
MEDDMWCVSSSGSSRSYRSETAAKYQSGPYQDLEEFEEVDDDIAVEYPCPFCASDYDLVELCHHIDEEHRHEANNGICPVCSKRVKMHMKEMSYREDPYLSDKYLQPHLDESPPSMNHHQHTSKHVSDQFLSFIKNSALPNQTKLVQSDSSVEDKNPIKDSSAAKEGTSSSPLSDSDKLEKAKKCEFVQGLLSSAMFDDECDSSE